MTARIPGRTLTGLVWATAVGILLQAVSAGQFISGLSNAVGVHAIVGSLLEAIGFVLVVAAVADRRTRRHCRGRWLAALLLGVALLIQASLGHAPGAVPTAMHVPLGVALFAWATVLAIAFARPTPPQRDVRPTAQPTAQAGSR
jgi:hypothetical protein